jgi:hypothetical protein
MNSSAGTVLTFGALFPCKSTIRQVTALNMQRSLPNQKESSVHPSTKLKKAPPQDANDGAPGRSGNKYTITTQRSSTNGPSNDVQQTEAMLPWKICTNGLLEKAYCAIDLLQDHDAASVNIQCELMDEMASTPWKSRVRQGWDDGRTSILGIQRDQVDGEEKTF